eukprot:scaffold93029_cov53-Attheya_sp.AAC.7
MDRDNEGYSIMSYRLKGTTQLIQSWLPGIVNAGFRWYGMPDSYMSGITTLVLHALVSKLLLTSYE